MAVSQGFVFFGCHIRKLHSQSRIFGRLSLPLITHLFGLIIACHFLFAVAGCCAARKQADNKQQKQSRENHTGYFV
jgi:hypothetical protein